MGSAFFTADMPAEEPRAVPETAQVLSDGPCAASARYHGEGGRVLADDFDVQRTILGKGISGTVVLAIGRLDGGRYALKRLFKRTMSLQDRKCLQREVEIHLAVSHPNIARLVDVYETSKEVALVTECCAGGELFERVTEQEKLAEPDAAVAGRQMLRAVDYLHHHQIAHRDLKLENFIFESKERYAPLKLIDFGFAKVWSAAMPKMHSWCGSIDYMSPDVLCGQGYTSKCDLWSVGVIVFILLSGYMPFSGDETAMQAAIKEGKVDWHGKAWLHVSEEALDFTKALLAFDPECRPDAKAALAHPWLAQRVSPEVPTPNKQVALPMLEYAGASRLNRAALQLLARELL